MTDLGQVSDTCSTTDNLQTSDDPVDSSTSTISKELNTLDGDVDVVMKEEVKGEAEDLDSTFASDRGAPNFLTETDQNDQNFDIMGQEQGQEQGQDHEESMDIEDKTKGDEEIEEEEEDDIIGPKCVVDPDRKDRIGTCKLFSANLPHKSDAESVRKIFEPYGKVVFVELFQNRTYAFIFMENEVGGENAIAELHEKELEEGSGKNLKVSKSDNDDPPPVPTVKLSVKNIPESISAKELRDLFSQYGLVVYCEIAGSTGTVALDQLGDIRSALNDMNGYSLGGHQITVKPQLSIEETAYKILKRRDQARSRKKAGKKDNSSLSVPSSTTTTKKTRPGGPGGFQQQRPHGPSWGRPGPGHGHGPGPGPWGSRSIRPPLPPPMGFGFGLRGPPPRPRPPFHPAFRGLGGPNFMRMPLRRPPDFYQQQQQQQQYNDYEEYEEYDNYNEDEGYNNDNYSQVPPSYNENNRRDNRGGGFSRTNNNNNNNRSGSASNSNNWVGAGGGYGKMNAGFSSGQGSKGPQGPQGGGRTRTRSRRGLGFKGNKGSGGSSISNSGVANNSGSSGGNSMLHLHRQRQQQQQQQQPQQQQQQQPKSLFQNIASLEQQLKELRQQSEAQAQQQQQPKANFKYDEDSYSLFPPYEFANEDTRNMSLGKREYSVPRKNSPDKIKMHNQPQQQQQQQGKGGRYFNYNHQPPLPREQPSSSSAYKPPLPKVPPPHHHQSQQPAASEYSPYPFYSLAPDTVVSTTGTIQGYIRRSEQSGGYTPPKATTKRERAIGPITVPPNKRNRFSGNSSGGNFGGGGNGGGSRGGGGGGSRGSRGAGGGGRNKPNKRERESRRAARGGGGGNGSGSGSGGAGNNFNFGGNNSNSNNNSFQPTKILQRPSGAGTSFNSNQNYNQNQQQQYQQGKAGGSQRDELKRSAQEDQANQYAQLMAQFYSEI